LSKYSTAVSATTTKKENFDILTD